MSRSQLEKISIADVPASAGAFDYYNTFSVVQEGSDEASRQVLSIEPASSPIIEDGQTLIASKNYDLTVSGLFKASTISGLQSLADARTEVVFGGFGLGGQILQMDGSLNLGQVFTETASFRFNSPREAKGSYDTTTGKHTAELCYSTNGLAMYKWQEGSSGLAAGWQKPSGTASWDSGNGEQDFSTTAVAGATMYRDLFLPCDGRTIYFNVDMTAASITTGANIKIEAFSDYADTNVGTADTTTIPNGSTDTLQASMVVPATAKMIRVSVNIGQDDSVSFKNPTVQLDSTYNFIEFNT
jgi:hypothetical protein